MWRRPVIEPHARTRSWAQKGYRGGRAGRAGGSPARGWLSLRWFPMRRPETDIDYPQDRRRGRSQRAECVIQVAATDGEAGPHHARVTKIICGLQGSLPDTGAMGTPPRGLAVDVLVAVRQRHTAVHAAQSGPRQAITGPDGPRGSRCETPSNSAKARSRCTRITDARVLPSESRNVTRLRVLRGQNVWL